MAAPNLKHVFEQGPVIGAIGRTVLSAMSQQLLKRPSAGVTAPGPEFTQLVRPRPAALIADFIRWTGGNRDSYRGVVPPAMFGQWGFPLQAKTLVGIDYPIARVLNGGCRMEINAPLPADEPLHLSARLDDIDDDGRRAIIRSRVVTGTPSAPEALVCYVSGFVPLGGGKDKGKKKKKDPERIPQDARELAYWRFGQRAGLEFATLTGDFNPVHWIPPYARAFGFRNVILHGFATMACAVEGMNRGLWAGDATRLETIDVRFVKPLLLPARVGLYVASDQRVFVGDAPGGPAYMVGSFTARPVAGRGER